MDNVGEMYIPNGSGAANRRGVAKGDGDRKALGGLLGVMAIHAKEVTVVAFAIGG